MDAFGELHAIPPQILADGYLARAVHGERLTLAVVEVEPDAELPEHRHDNEQFGIVIQGSAIFRVGDQERSLGPGGIWRIPSTTPHTVTAGEAGAVVIDLLAAAGRLESARSTHAASIVLAVTPDGSQPSLPNATHASPQGQTLLACPSVRK